MTHFGALRQVLKFTSKFAAILLLGLLVTLQPMLAQAQSRLPIVRDAEIEQLLNDYARPLFRAAGLPRDRFEIILVNQRSFNAFVSGRRIFMHLGAIVEAETPNEIIGVLAHEIGHLAGGHQDRLRQQLDRAQAITVVSALIGLGAAAAAGTTGNGNLVGAGGGAVAGGAEAANRGLLAYRRTEEAAADRAAIDYLNATGQSARGMLETFKRFDDNLALNRGRVNPYRISHPLPRDRIAALETLARQSPHFNKRDSASLQLRHDKARAKILAYTYGRSAVDAFARENPGRAAQYGQAIADFLYGNPNNAIPKIDRLIAQEPSNAFYYEIKGEALLLARNADGAVNTLTRAVRLSNGRYATMQVALGHALVLKGDQASLRRATGELEVAITLDPFNPRAYRHLAMAYGRLGDAGNAELATAEEKFYSGQYADAKRFAARAQRRFQRNEPQWLRADDIRRFEVPRRR